MNAMDTDARSTISINRTGILLHAATDSFADNKIYNIIIYIMPCTAMMVVMIGSVRTAHSMVLSRICIYRYCIVTYTISMSKMHHAHTMDLSQLFVPILSVYLNCEMRL